jgi:phytoene/squalene synthetase
LGSRFMSAEVTAQLLAIYALRQSISAIPLNSIDDTVKWVKLKWWSEEMTADTSAPERHPVLRALDHSGARQQLENSLLLRLIGDAVSQIDSFPDADSRALMERLASLGETDILLESALGETLISDTILKSMSLATGIYSCVTLLLNDYPNKVQLLPLDWLAEFQVKAEDLKTRPPATELQSLVQRLAGQGADAFRAGFEAADRAQMSHVPMHLRLRWSLEARFLERVKRNAERYFSRKNTYGLPDVWFAWSTCRQN